MFVEMLSSSGGGSITKGKAVARSTGWYSTENGRVRVQGYDDEYINGMPLSTNSSNGTLTNNTVTFKKKCKLLITIGQGSVNNATVTNTLVVYRNGTENENEIYRKTLTSVRNYIEWESLIYDVEPGDYFYAYMTVNTSGVNVSFLEFTAFE